MTQRKTTEPAKRTGAPDGDDWGWESHRVAQLRAALRMTPAERLAWLERTNASMLGLLGLARGRGSE